MAHSDFRSPANQTCDLCTVTARLDTPSWLSQKSVINCGHKIRGRVGYVCGKIVPRGLGRNVKRKTGKKAYAFVSGTERFVWQTFWLAKGNLGSCVLNFSKKLKKKVISDAWGETDFWMLPAAVILYHICLCYSNGLFLKNCGITIVLAWFFLNLLPTPGCTMRQLQVHSY